MRLFLLPISTRRTLLYCKYKGVVKTPEQQSYADKATSKAAELWAGWEKRESGWQKTVVTYGNKALKRIPYEEWGLRSVPPLSARKREKELSGKEKVEVYFPPSLIAQPSVAGVLKKLGTERQALHKRRMVWCFVGMPISAPVALLPVIPNIPFFYLVYRAWAHWRALTGSKHIEFLVDNALITPVSSQLLDDIYTSNSGRLSPASRDAPTPTTSNSELSEDKRIDRTAEQNTNTEGRERIVLSKAQGADIAKAVKLPELELEIERAIWQVETALSKEQKVEQ